MLKKILVANRGEIAVRIIETCRELGIPNTVIYSTADRDSLAVQLAEQAYCIGPPPPLESYLNIEAIIDAATRCGADAIHPGYGFLAENSDFAEACEETGIRFIGPTSRVLRLMGNKLEARSLMIQSDVPVIPGMVSKEEDMGMLEREAERIGYPILIKAAAGGGGKGMRVVRSPEALQAAVEGARRESLSAFGDPTVYIEKYLVEPRHIEFQMLADHHGNVIHLFERECSIQRRHQKIVEETPSVALDPELRSRMAEVATRVIRSAGYTNAGTVEFLLDRDKNFYFLEINARIQVEHPITEITTGVDLVKEQIRIASHEPLTIRQDDLQQRGHAIECRIYAEDAENNFLPCPGRIHFMKEPAGPRIRNDCGIYNGCEVSMHYDPILSKLVTWGDDREGARKVMLTALEDYVILGIKTCIPFLKEVIAHPKFISGETHTDFVERHFPNWCETKRREHRDEALVAAAIHAYEKASGPVRVGAAVQKAPTPWQTLGSWQLGAR
jgi:acetyl-CoA carboxylase biotin carboxylase subunit